MLMEETVGLGLASFGMITARGTRILQELDLFFCDVAVGATINFILTWLLTPTIQKGASTGPLSRYLASLPANVFAKSSGAHQYSVVHRMNAFLYKGLVFSAYGFAAAVVGTSISYSLLAIRSYAASRSTPTLASKPSAPSPERPQLLQNSIAWAGFMFLSSNPRYQVLAGLERMLFSMGQTPFVKLSCLSLRTLNNVIGGAIWVRYAKWIGLQA